MPVNNGLNLHLDPAFFREMVNYTAAKTNFNPRLVEKDYFCSLLLTYITAGADNPLVFKGGTCLAKVYAGFYRLSEDLDFVIPMPVDSSRTARHNAVAKTRELFGNISEACQAFNVREALTGANNSTQYNGTLEYTSIITGESEPVLFEVSLREPLYMPVNRTTARTALLSPIDGKPVVRDVPVCCIDFTEAFAEKFRAALSRREVAIRDFYEIEYAVRNLGLNTDSGQLLSLVNKKMAIPG